MAIELKRDMCISLGREQDVDFHLTQRPLRRRLVCATQLQCNTAALQNVELFQQIFYVLVNN